MALTPLTPRQQIMIANNIVAACRDITKLKKIGYNFIYLASGFIAHYNLLGFQDAYKEPGSLKKAILANQANNQWLNFHPGERDYEYYKSKARTYNKICDRLTLNQ